MAFSGLDLRFLRTQDRMKCGDPIYEIVNVIPGIRVGIE